MSDGTSLEPARDPQDLERFLVARQRVGNIDGMMVLFEADAVVDLGGGRILRGAAACRTYYEELKVSWELGKASAISYVILILTLVLSASLTWRTTGADAR